MKNDIEKRLTQIEKRLKRIEDKIFFEERQQKLSDLELLKRVKKSFKQGADISATILQRKLRLGYARAARLLGILEEEGLIKKKITKITIPTNIFIMSGNK